VKSGLNADIDFLKIQSFIMWMTSLGFWIRRVTFDSWNSVYIMQRLEEFGLNVKTFSVDTTIWAYKELRTGFNERRIRLPKNDHLFDELSALIYDAVADKCDHPKTGSKDTADALAAAVYQCSKDVVMPSQVPDYARNAGSNKANEVFSPFMAKLVTLEAVIKGE
jgi:phage terminase large subunit-like protein